MELVGEERVRFFAVGKRQVRGRESGGDEATGWGEPDVRQTKQ